MKHFLFTLLICVLALDGYSQTNIQPDEHEKIKPYRTWVIGKGKGKVKIEGILYSSSDSSIFIIPYNKQWTASSKNSITEISIEKISKVKLRRLNSASNGALWGFAIAGAGGLALGGAAGAYGDAVVLGAFLGGVIFGGIGAGIGSFFGSIKKNYDIQYSLNIYQSAYIKEFVSKSLIGQGIEF